MTHEPPKHRTIRIRLETYRRLKVLAAQMGITMVDLIERWVADSEGSSADNSAAQNHQSRGARSNADTAQ